MRSGFGAGALIYRFVPALQVRAGFRDLHIRPTGEIHRRQRRRIGDGETLAGDKGVIGQLAIEFGEEAVQPGAAAITQLRDRRDRVGGTRQAALGELWVRVAEQF